MVGRRQFVAYSGAGALALALGSLGLGADSRAAPVTRTPKALRGYPFSLGVASGDPLEDSVILWTRLAPEPLASKGGMPDQRVPVKWQVADDEGFQHIVRDGTAYARPQYVHAVHVNVRGLRPGRDYFYRFKMGSEISPVGRTRTAPARGTLPERFRFAVTSCQAWFDGYYTAYKHLAGEDVDLVVHLGDYLYEYGVQTNGGRPDAPTDLHERFFSETRLLSDYRDRYALYKLDPHLQAAHAAAPWLVTWDDHEVVDNYANLDHPSSPPEEFLVRRANAYRSYWEHMPLRLPEPAGPDLPLYRRFGFGDLLEFNVLDTRQYRDDQACGDGLDTDCAERLDPARTLLGADQETWLLDGLGNSSARWNLLAEQIMLSQIDFTSAAGQAFGMDLWDGYKPARDRVLTGLTERQVANPIVLSGDFHRAMVADVKQDFDDPDSPTIATEFLGTSISSGMDGADMDEYGKEFLAANAHVKFYNGQRGYLRCVATPDEFHADYRTVPYVKADDGAEVFTRASFVTENGVPGAQPVGENAPRGTKFSTDVEPPGPLETRGADR